MGLRQGHALCDGLLKAHLIRIVVKDSWSHARAHLDRRIKRVRINSAETDYPYGAFSFIYV